MFKKNKFLSLLLIFLSINLYSQSNIKRYFLVLNDENNAPDFIYDSNLDELVYSGNDADVQIFFSQYIVKSFEQAFPHSNRSKLLKGFFLESPSSTIGDDLVSEFPAIYLVSEDITNLKVKLASTPYTPNDYQVASSFQLINNYTYYDLNDFKYIDTPKAWGITPGGSSDILIGVSDAKVDDTLLDLDNNKVSFLNNNYVDVVPNCNISESTHGTDIALVAAGEGDNNETSLGICYNCNIIAADYKGPIISTVGAEYDARYDYLLQLAQNGARVINISWGNALTQTPEQLMIGPNQNIWEFRADLIDEIVNDEGVVLVAAAGNDGVYNSDDSLEIRYDYPASFDGVISVSGVNHWYTIDNYPYQTAVSQTGRLSKKWIKNSISTRVDVTDSEPVGLYSYEGIVIPLTTYNDRVDIVAPAYSALHPSVLQYSCTNKSKYTAPSTSIAAPMVTGTVGLMLSINECLQPNQVEDILKLTSEDIEYDLNSDIVEVASLNQHFDGLFGAGKLETGDAVEFVNEISKSDGVAKIKDHIFTRYSYNLNNILNELEIENSRFVMNCTADFSAKNSIELFEGTVLLPSEGNNYIRLELDSSIGACMPSSSRKPIDLDNNLGNGSIDEIIDPYKVFPTLFKDLIEVKKNKNTIVELAKVSIYNIYGVEVFLYSNSNNDSITLNLENLSEGIYILKLFDLNGESIQTQKIIKK